jgi:uroporphyrinogen decarboxylase
MPTMSKRERVWAAVHGETVDRPPFFFWHHFTPHNVPHSLAASTLDFFGRYDLDIYKIMPDMPYPFPANSIHRPDDWDLVAPLSPTAGNLGRMVQTTELVRRAVGPETPVVVTVYSPITEARRFAGGWDALRRELAESPDHVHRALGTIANNLAGYTGALLEAGADGIYYAVQGAAGGVLTEAEFREFARPYDLLALGRASPGWLNVVHLHGGPEVMPDLVLGYPGAALSWEDRLTGVSLSELRPKLGGKAAMGGIDERGPIVRGDVAGLTGEIREALAQTEGGRHFILAPGCSVPDDIPESSLTAARQVVAQILE